MDERERRIGLNEALYREVNERLRDINETFGALTERVEILCECADPPCAERLSLSLDEYERVRAESGLFLVVPGHADAGDVEEVVRRGEMWEVVRKRAGAPTRLAEKTDPRR